MRDYMLAHLSDAALLRELTKLVARDRETTATLLAHIAEVDARRAYVPEGCPSMFAYCVERLRLSEDAAYKRIQAARAARQFPSLFAAVSDGRLHLTAVCLLAPHLTAENVPALIDAATHRKKSEIEAWLAGRFAPAGGSAASPRAVSSITPLPRPALGPSEPELALEQVGSHESELALEQVVPAVTPLERFLVQVTIDGETHDKLRHARALLSHAVPSGDLAKVLDRALDALIAQFEKGKLGAGSRPTSRRRKATRSRYIPAHIRRAVWERDHGQCTFVGPNGHRCESRRFLEFDHAEPFARGGTVSVDGIRLRCRAHNQYEAERVFGAGFMSERRHEARLARANRRSVPSERAAAGQQAAAAKNAAREQAADVVAGLRSLGCRADEARRAADFSTTIECDTLEERMRAALGFLTNRSGRRSTGVFHVRERVAPYGTDGRGRAVSHSLARDRPVPYGIPCRDRTAAHVRYAHGRLASSPRRRHTSSPRGRRAMHRSRANLAPCTPSPTPFGT